MQEDAAEMQSAILWDGIAGTVTTWKGGLLMSEAEIVEDLDEETRAAVFEAVRVAEIVALEVTVETTLNTI
jgi:hypothetical protein